MELTTFLQELIILNKESKQTKVALEKLKKENADLKEELNKAIEAAKNLRKENDDLKDRTGLIKKNETCSAPPSCGSVYSMIAAPYAPHPVSSDGARVHLPDGT